MQWRIQHWRFTCVSISRIHRKAQASTMPINIKFLIGAARRATRRSDFSTCESAFYFRHVSHRWFLRLTTRAEPESDRAEKHEWTVCFNERDAFTLIEADCSAAIILTHLLELDSALCERAINEATWCLYQPDEHLTERVSRLITRLLRLCSIAYAKRSLHNLSFPSTRRLCIPSHMHYNASSQRAFSKCPRRLRARILIALDRFQP